jgi:predicted AAA+ superfamily ATPase
MTLIKRQYNLLKIEDSIKKMPITVLIGARQIGKTSLMNSLEFKMPIYKIDAQTNETQALFSKTSDVESLLKIKLNENLEGLFIIDEFQFINKISTKLKILVDANKALKILCSGSSSIDIIQNVEESLAGRVRVLNINSLSFSESLLFTNKQLYNEYNKYDTTTSSVVISPEIKQKLNNNLIFGGMPRVVLENNIEDKIQILDDIYRTYLLRDVKSYVRNQDSVGFNKLLQILAIQISNLVNINDLSKSTGLTYNKCEEYLYLLEQMYIIKLISPFETNKKKAIKKMRKVYFLDLGLRNKIINNFNDIDLRVDNGAIFENFGFLEIIKRMKPYSIINFYRTRDGAEVDFIINDMIKLISIEVKYKDLIKPVFYKALSNFNKDENIINSFVVNLNLNETSKGVKFIQSILMEKIFKSN